ncbi:hypothetical protein SteCoe_9073 [Stentor coeruleus]|uniref:non-specific serine/threonine protein kinase n=1 Tax=Stentor coeruleus TaxID=5963 RepID=A0A1R2CIQ0_9CILI|nr:hypothetical protein SteCoe_9073 [Stentor coeruleus]
MGCCQHSIKEVEFTDPGIKKEKKEVEFTDPGIKKETPLENAPIFDVHMNDRFLLSLNDQSSNPSLEIKEVPKEIPEPVVEQAQPKVMSKFMSGLLAAKAKVKEEPVEVVEAVKEEPVEVVKSVKATEDAEVVEAVKAAEEVEAVKEKSEASSEKPLLKGSLKFFGGLVKSTIEKSTIIVKEQIENVEKGTEYVVKQVEDAEIAENLKQIADDAIVNSECVVREGVKRSATIIQEQVAIIKEGLQETINAIKDLGIKKRVTDIIYPMLKKFFVHSITCDIEKKYTIHEILGTGGFSTVKRVIDKITGIERAAKIFVKNSMTEKQTDILMKEVDALKAVDHPNIIQVVEIVEDFSKICLITEICSGGELFDRIASTEGFDESMAASIMYQILSGLIHVHQNGYIHGDMKPENILFIGKDCTSLKIIDFGVSKSIKKEEKQVNCIGTAYYIAPESLEGVVTNKSDIWSCGVILYMMLCGMPPFNGRNDEEILKKVRRGIFDFSHKRWKNVSKNAKDLIQKMLNKDPERRFSASEAWNHSWVQSSVTKENQLGELGSSVLKHLAAFRANTRLQQATFSYIASSMTTSNEIDELRKAFIILDTDGNGHLSELELRRGFSNISLSASVKLEDILKSCDSDMNGQIDYSEFITAAIDWHKHLSKEILENTFKAYDKDDSGSISITELREFLGGDDDKMDEFWKQLLEDADSNGDGVIDLQEFKELMLRKENS